MIKFTDFITPPNPQRTKVKFNMNASDASKPAWDFLLDDDDEWLLMNKWKTKHPSNNLNHADYIIAMKDGIIHGEGIPEKVITPEVLNPVFGHEFNITERDGKSVCLYFN